MNIEISDESIKYFSEPAKRQLIIEIKHFITSILDEANRIEAESRENKEKPDISRVNISDAAISYRKGFHKQKPPWRYTILQLFSAMFVLFTGIFITISVQYPQNPLNLYLFIFVLCVAIILSTIQIVVGRFL